MSVHAFIFARGGSKGVPGKNVKPLAGKPLIEYSIDIALNNNSIEQVFVSTDDAEIARVSRNAGATVIERPPELAQDNSPEWAAWQHAINSVLTEHGGRYADTFISLPATSPMRNNQDVTNALQTFANGSADMVISITEAARSPYFNMVKPTNQGLVELVIGTQEYTRRQDVPKVFDITTVAYVSSFKHVLQSTSLFEGSVAGFEVPVERSMDIDTQHDFEVANYLMEKRIANENLK